MGSQNQYFSLIRESKYFRNREKNKDSSKNSNGEIGCTLALLSCGREVEKDEWLAQVQHWCCWHWGLTDLWPVSFHRALAVTKCSIYDQYVLEVEAFPNFCFIILVFFIFPFGNFKPRILSDMLIFDTWVEHGTNTKLANICCLLQSDEGNSKINLRSIHLFHRHGFTAL